MMWGFASNAIGNIGLKKNSRQPSRGYSDCSDDEICSNGSKEEGLECPICWESFNIVENVPYVLWCGHTLCHNCVLGLQSALVKLPAQEIKVPCFISCPWCHLLSLRLFYNGVLKFPRKNFFLLSMIESLSSERVKLVHSCGENNQPVWSPKCNLILGNKTSSGSVRQTPCNHITEQLGSHSRSTELRPLRHKSLDLFIHFTSKFPFVIMLILIVFCVVPGSILVLALYLVLTVVFAVPSFLVLCCAFRTVDMLMRELTS